MVLGAWAPSQEREGSVTFKWRTWDPEQFSKCPVLPITPLGCSHHSVDSPATGSPPGGSTDFSPPFSEGNWSKERGVAGTQWVMQAGEEAHHPSSCKAHLQGHSVLDLRNLIFTKLATEQQPHWCSSTSVSFLPPSFLLAFTLLPSSFLIPGITS